MDQFTGQEVFGKENSKAKIGLVFGLLAFVAWSFVILGPWSVVYVPYIGLALAIIGIIFALLGFKAHKVKAILAIVLCLINIAPAVMLTQFRYSQGEIGKQTYGESDFSIELPPGWVKIDPQIGTPTLKSAFAMKDSKDTYQPRIMVFSRNLQTSDITAFGKIRESEIKADNTYTFVSGKLADPRNTSKISNYDGKDLYVIRYNLTKDGNTIKITDFLKLNGNIGYIVSASAQEATYTYYNSQISDSLFSFKVK